MSQSWALRLIRQAGHGTRLIPDGTLHGVTYVKAKDWMQVSGTGDFTKINIAPGDSGGQFDSSQNTPSGAQMFVDDQNTAASSWVVCLGEKGRELIYQTLISADTFCVRACTGDPSYCPTQYDQMGCWFLTGNAVGPDETWQDCQSDEGDPPGVVDGTTLTQGADSTPTPTAPATSACSSGTSAANGQTPPPLYAWDGTGSAVPLTPGATQSGVQTGSAAGSSQGANSASSAAGSGGASTTWLPVQTCTPCGSLGGATGLSTATNSAVASSATSTGSAAGTTQQQGVTQMSNNGLEAIQITGAGASSAIASDAATTGVGGSTGGGGGDDLIMKRGTTTSNGQCCFTTWTSSVVGGSGLATATSSASGSSGGVSSSGKSVILTGSSNAGATGTGGVTTAGGTAGASTGTAKASASASASANLTSGNITAGGTGNSSAAWRLELEGVEGLVRVMIGTGAALLFGMAVGGAVLL